MKKLDRLAVAELNAALNKALLELVVFNERPDFAKWEPILELGNALVKHEPWSNHIQPFDTFEIVANAVRKLNANWKKDTSERASETLSKQQFDELERSIRAFLLSIPRKHELLIELPSMPRWGAGELSLTSRMFLLEIEEPKKNTLAEIARLAANVEKEYTGVCLRIVCSGYGTSSNGSSAVVDAVSQIKQFFEFFRSTKIYKAQGPSILSQIRGPKVRARLTDAIDSIEIDTIELPERIQAFLSNVSINEEILKYFEPGKGFFAAGNPRPPTTRNEKSEALKSEIGWIAKVIDCPSEWSDAERIRSALEWGFDSAQNDNQTLALIQACIGLEALLGDDDQKEPLTTRLADRCAYLLGKGHKNRVSLRKQFLNMYEVRSKLIHGRTPRLNHSDATHLFFAQTTLTQVIWQEMNTLLKTLEANKDKK